MNANTRLISKLLTAVFAALLIGGALAQGNGDADNERDPILVQVGSTVERASAIEWRFQVAIRNIIAQQGMPYTAEIAAQLRMLMPTYLEQRAQELALVVEAQRRGITPDEEQIEATLEG